MELLPIVVLGFGVACGASFGEAKTERVCGEAGEDIALELLPM